MGLGHNYTIIFISDLYTRLIKNLGHVSRVRSCDDQSPGPSWGRRIILSADFAMDVFAEFNITLCSDQWPAPARHTM